MQDINDIHYFVQVVERGTFTKASKALGIARSQLSSRIARLEGNLGVRLIQRTTRQSHVTDIGRLYYRECLRILAAAEQAQRVIEDAQGVPRGRIRVGCPVLFARLLLTPLLSEFLDRYPDVRISLDICSHHTDVVASGLDIAFQVRQSMDDSSLIVRSFGSDPQVMVGAPRLLRRHGRPAHPADLADLPSVTLPSHEGRHFWMLLDRARHALQVEHHPRLTSDDLYVLLEAAVGGVGIARLPAWLCREFIARGCLVALLDGYQIPPCDVHAVYPSRHGHTPALRSFIDFAAQQIPVALRRLHGAAAGGAAGARAGRPG